MYFKLWFLGLFIGTSTLVSAQANQFRLATYNSLKYSPNNIDQRHPSFRTVINAIDPDLLVLEELNGRDASAMFLDSVMNFSGSIYDTSTYVNGPDTDIALFYKKSKFAYIGTQVYPTALRHIYHFTVKPINGNDTLHIFGVHLKASSGGANEILRAAEVDTLRKYTAMLPKGSYSVVCGDFNIYKSTEPAYIGLLNNTPGDDGHFVDQINMSGSWNDVAYATYHTQSPRTTQFNGGANGGMDDRFDLILMSRAIDSTGGIDYKSGSLTAFGNDGQHYNAAITDLPANSAVSATVANALHYASDHLPVYADFVFDTTAASGSIVVDDIDTVLLAEYDRENNTTGNCVISAQNTYETNHITATAICRTGAVSNTGGDINSRGWPQANSIDLGYYYSFSIAPQVGNRMYLSKVKFRIDRSGTGPDQIELRSSDDVYTASLATINSLSANGETVEFNLDINSTENIEFRIYAYNASGSSGTLDIEGYAGEQLADPGISVYGYTVPEIVWDGNQWNTGISPSGNLSNGKLIIKKGAKAQINDDISAVKSIVVEAGGLLEISNSYEVSLQDSLIIEANAVDGSGQVSGKVNGALQYNNVVQGTVARWHSLAFPANSQLQNVSLGSAPLYTSQNGTANQVNTWYYDAQTIDATSQEGVWTRVASLANTLNSGFSVYLGPPYFGSFPLSIQVKGVYQNNVNIPVYHQASVPLTNQGWNHIPNPFTSALSWSTIKTDNALLGATYYVDSAGVWKFHNGITGNGSNYIAVGQSFFVKTTGAGNLSFNQSQTTVDESPILYKMGLNQLKLSVNNGYAFDEHFLVFDNTLSSFFDIDFDGRKLKNTGAKALHIYSVDSAGSLYAINGMPELQNGGEVPIFIESQEDTVISLRFNTFGKASEKSFKWVDVNALDTAIINNGQSIFISVNAGVNAYKIIQSSSSSIGNLERLQKGIFIRNEWNSVFVESPENNLLTLELFDMNGKLKARKNFTSSISISDIVGAYTLSISDSDGNVLKSQVVILK